MMAAHRHNNDGGQPFSYALFASRNKMFFPAKKGYKYHACSQLRDNKIIKA